MKFKVEYNRGYGTRIINAKNMDDAKKEAMVQYRLHSLMVDYLTQKDMIKSIEPVE